MFAEFDLVMPGDLDEALDILAEAGGDGDAGILPLAGGTNLVVDLRARRIRADKLVGLGRIAALRGIERSNGRVTIGAGTTLSDILRDPGMVEAAPSLVDSARVFAGQMVRNTATVAGNVCCGSPAADTVPPLLSLDAEVTLAGKGGTRNVPLADFFLGYQEDERRPAELVTKIAWDAPKPKSANLFYKLARRKGDAITVVGVAVTVAVEAGKCTTARIALGAVAPVVKRAREAEALLEGEALTPELIEAAARQAAEDSSPIDDVRASADYRRHSVHALTRRLLSQAWAQVTEGG
ncbi:MAG: xanthine dehydrogenase family protein subunit M [Rhodospirillales bacterium]|nr:xanthine dehydrogenase family protein subunit M [Rhodospirillales bacterium]MDH3918229.1 xanthine dehydrogenase family protein subunit M [Rhodospirillales bacterium]MDH3969111.1 xanthine dehydrogenase family protein subunit M [Rhodospirillales bacterium]